MILTLNLLVQIYIISNIFNKAIKQVLKKFIYLLNPQATVTKIVEADLCKGEFHCLMHLKHKVRRIYYKIEIHLHLSRLSTTYDSYYVYHLFSCPLREIANFPLYQLTEIGYSLIRNTYVFLYVTNAFTFRLKNFNINGIPLE